MSSGISAESGISLPLTLCLVHNLHLPLRLKIILLSVELAGKECLEVKNCPVVLALATHEPKQE